MKTFYSIIKIAPNTSAGDSLSIGLILRDHKKFCLQFSDNKKRAAKNLLGENSEIVEFLIKQIEQKIQEVNQDLKNSDNLLINTPHIINSDYFIYLNKYSNGVLQFAAPVMIDDEVNEEKFKKLFNILIDKEPLDVLHAEDLKEKKFIQRIEKKLIKRVQDKVHTNVRFDSKLISNLHFSFEMDCIGLNGAFTGAKAISFYKGRQTIDVTVSHYYILIDSIVKKYHKSNKLNVFYVIADEPALINSPEYKIWEAINKQDHFKVVNSEESGEVADKIEKSRAKKFIEEVEPVEA